MRNYPWSTPNATASSPPPCNTSRGTTSPTCLLKSKRISRFHTSETISTGSAKRCVGGCASSGELVIFRPEFVEKILAGEPEAARILEPGYAGSVRRYHSRWRVENRAALAIQGFNALRSVLELEGKVKEQEKILERIKALEQTAETAKGGSRWGV